MFDKDEIDRLIVELEEFLPQWAGRYSEDTFVRMLAQASDYICSGAYPACREHAFARTGYLVVNSGAEFWKSKYGTACPRNCGTDGFN